MAWATKEDRQQYYRKTRNEHYWRNLRNKYGLSQDEFFGLLDMQEHSCALCKDPFKSLRQPNLHIDHCHETNQVRGLLCMKCNVGLGMLGDNVEGLTRALAYVKEFEDA